MWPDFLAGWIRLRTQWRGFELPLLASPLLPAAFIGTLAGEQRIVVGCLLGFGASLLAARRLRRGRLGDARFAAWIMAVGTGLAGFMGAGLGLFALLLAAGAFFGTRHLFAALPEHLPPPAPPPPPPAAIVQARARLARVMAVADARGDARLRIAASAVQDAVEELAGRPDRLAAVQPFLSMQVDGLERIAARLANGATPPPELTPLLDDFTTAARDLHERIRRDESAALALHVQHLTERLRAAGY
jgi:hypothetical protein